MGRIDIYELIVCFLIHTLIGSNFSQFTKDLALQKRSSMKILSTVLLIPIIVLTIFYFRLYHRIFTVYYLKNMVFEIFWELLVSFVLAMVTVGLIGQGILVILKFLGRAVSVLVKIIVVAAVIGGVGWLLYTIITKLLKEKNSGSRMEKAPKENEKEKKSESTEECVMTVCPECGSICSSENQFCDQCGHTL